MFVADKSEPTVRIDVHGERDAFSLFPLLPSDPRVSYSPFPDSSPWSTSFHPPLVYSPFIGLVELVGRLTGCASFLQRDIFLDEFDGLFMASMWGGRVDI